MSSKIKNTAKFLAIGTVSFIAVTALKAVKEKSEKHKDEVRLTEYEEKAWQDVKRNAGFMD